MTGRIDIGALVQASGHWTEADLNALLKLLGENERLTRVLGEGRPKALLTQIQGEIRSAVLSAAYMSVGD